MQITFDNTYANLPTHFHHMQGADPVSSPALIAWNNDLARELGIVAQDEAEIAGVFSGNQTVNGARAGAGLFRASIRYFNPQLGTVAPIAGRGD